MKKHHEDKETIVYTGTHMQTMEHKQLRIAKIHYSKCLCINGLIFTPRQIKKLAKKMIELL